ncbi:hypothetical protein, partial [Escherichia coli]|uniref:hypothetical protein n=1 Tax=Escherichia coli TaxID=562 RepID=UPI00195FB208
LNILSPETNLAVVFSEDPSKVNFCDAAPSMMVTVVVTSSHPQSLPHLQSEPHLQPEDISYSDPFKHNKLKYVYN